MTSPVRTILIVDDEKTILDHLSSFFKGKGWDVMGAPHGKAALQMLKIREWSCSCIILDQRMPEMDGLTFLRTLRKQEPRNAQIPVIVLSAYVRTDTAAGKSFRKYGTARVFQKPQEPDLLEVVANAIINPVIPYNRGKQDKRNMRDKQEERIESAITTHELNQRVQQNEALVAQYYRAKISKRNLNFRGINEPLFLVARRWNSWYPSFFDVSGGSYAIAMPACKETRRPRVAAIDPGFRFLKVLAEEFGLSVQDLETCIITHNHPDHMGGVFEYIACRYEADRPTTFHCNPSTRRMLAEMAGAKVTARELPGNDKEDVLLDYCDLKGKYRTLGVRAFPTDHREAGWDSDSRGLVLSCHAGLIKGDREITCRTVILGDSAFDEANHYMEFPAILAGDENTKIAVLHIGSAQIKRRVGGHLYLTGLGRLVQQIAGKLEACERNRDNKLVVLVSEWGLEHATAEQIEAICPDLKGFEKASAITATIDILRKGLHDLGYDRMTLLPADIGLMVGMETGMVYLKKPNGKFRKVRAEQVKFRAASSGLEYF